MESTGIYWMALYDILQEHSGFNVERQIIALTNCITRSKYSYKIKIT